MTLFFLVIFFAQWLLVGLPNVSAQSSNATLCVTAPNVTMSSTVVSLKCIYMYSKFKCTSVLLPFCFLFFVFFSFGGDFREATISHQILSHGFVFSFSFLFPAEGPGMIFHPTKTTYLALCLHPAANNVNLKSDTKHLKNQVRSDIGTNL